MGALREEVNLIRQRSGWFGFAAGSGFRWGLKFGDTFLAITSSACAILESSASSLSAAILVPTTRIDPSGASANAFTLSFWLPESTVQKSTLLPSLDTLAMKGWPDFFGSPAATPKTMQAVNSDCRFLDSTCGAAGGRRVAQFHVVDRARYLQHDIHALGLRLKTNVHHRFLVDGARLLRQSTISTVTANAIADCAIP